MIVRLSTTDSGSPPPRRSRHGNTSEEIPPLRKTAQHLVGWWPLGLILIATAWLWQPILSLFWYQDDYALLYWLGHPAGPANPADVGDFKLPIYHGLLEIHWPAYQLFGVNPLGHNAVQLGLLLIAACLGYALALRLSRSPLVATLASTLLVTSPVALSVAERVSLGYQGYLVLIILFGVLLLLLRWSGWEPAPARSRPERKAVGWLLAAGLLFLVGLFFVGVRLHAAFVGIGALALWLVWPDPKRRQQALWLAVSLALVTIGMVLHDGLGRNSVALAPTFLGDLVRSIGHLALPSTGVEGILRSVETAPASIILRYRLLASAITAGSLLLIATLADRRSRWVWCWALLTFVLGFVAINATPDVSAGDRTIDALTWLGILSGITVLTIFGAVATSWRLGWPQQLMTVGLGWAILGFLPAFLVQPGAPFGSADKYFISSVPGLLLATTGALSIWKLRAPWLLGLVLPIALIGSQIVRTDLARQSANRTVPATRIYTALEPAAHRWPVDTRVVLLADPSSQAAYHLHEVLSTGTINTEAVFTILYGLPYDTRHLAIRTLEQVAQELNVGTIRPDQVFVYGYGVASGLVDLSELARQLLPSVVDDSSAVTARQALLQSVQ